MTHIALSSNLKIDQADWADIWHTGSLAVSAVTHEPVRLKPQKITARLGRIKFFKVSLFIK